MKDLKVIPHGIMAKNYRIDFEKVKSIEDIVIVLKALNICVQIYDNNPIEGAKELDNKGLLIEIK